MIQVQTNIMFRQVQVIELVRQVLQGTAVKVSSFGQAVYFAMLGRRLILAHLGLFSPALFNLFISVLLLYSCFQRMRGADVIGHYCLSPNIPSSKTSYSHCSAKMCYSNRFAICVCTCICGKRLLQQFCNVNAYHLRYKNWSH